LIVFPTPEQNLFLKAWVEQRLNAALGDCRCLGVMRDNRLVAVAAFNNYKEFPVGSKRIPCDIELSFASDNPRWATRQVVTWILSYPFVQLKTQRVTLLVKKSNRIARKLAIGLGFQHEGTHAHAANNLEAVMSYGLTRVDFMERYLSGLKTSTDTAASA